MGELFQSLVRDREKIDWRRDVARNLLGEALPKRLRAGLRMLVKSRRVKDYPALTNDFVSKTRLKERIAVTQAKPHFFRPGQARRYWGLQRAAWSQGAASMRKQYNRRSIEMVIPYRDQNVVEFVFAIPADQLGRPRRDRWIQRNAARGLIAEEVRERQARTVFLPLMQKGLLEKERATVDELLKNPEIVRRGYVVDGWLEQSRLETERSRMPDHVFWRCLSLELWLRKFW